MTKKVQKILLIIFLSALIIALMAASFLYASTYGRYSGGTLSDDSTYDDTIEFIGTERYIVRTPEELNDAIENGYSYIQIADDAEQPFVITTDVQDVSTNLVLDLNGTVVVRNSRNPMLNVSQGVSVVLVYDSSEEHAGAFYNPVGSALQVSGGTMTIGSGNYESGPRTNEYADATAAGTLSPQTDDIVLFSRGGVTSPATVDRVNGTTFSPVTIAENTSYVPVTTGNYYYQSEADSGYSFLTEDTFLIYTLEEGEIAEADSSYDEGTLLVDGRPLAVPCNVASCDFYYYYATGDKAEDGTDIYAVVYGYWDVKELAEQGSSLESAGLQWPYAAIRMTAGEGFVRGGNFVNQFDVANTYGILTEENSKDGATGSLVVSETGRAGTTNFTARGEAVCIGCWEGDVAISGGNFSSELGNTIVMSGGELNITAGNFNKNVQASAKEGNGAAISMQGGDLTIAGTQTDTKSVQFTVTGSYVNGIEAAGGTINATNASFLFNGTSAGNNTGVASEGGQVKLTRCTFTMPGDNNRGIASQVTVASRDGEDTSVTNCTFTLEGSNNRGVYVSGGRTSISGGELNVGNTDTNGSNFGIEAAGGRVDAENATINVYGGSSAGIHTYGTSPLLNITGTFNCTVTQETGALLSSAAIMATSGSVTFETDSGTITSNGVGIVVRGGTLAQNSGALTVNTQRGTGIYIANGNFTQAAESKLTVNSEIDGIYWGSFIAGNTVTEQTQTTNGIYITGGSLIANGTLNVTHTGKDNAEYNADDNADYSGTDYAFLQQKITSYAVRVQGTTSTFVTINAGKITNSIGGGVYVSGGTVTLGSQTSNVGPTVTTTGQSVFSAQYVVGNSWRYSQSKTGGHAVEVSGGNLTVNGGSYTAAHGNGILVRNTGDSQNEVTINGGTFIGNTVTTGGSGTVGPGVSYGLNIMGKNLTVTIKGGNFGKKNNAGRVNSAASFYGIPVTDAARPQVEIHGGTFEGYDADVISVFRFVDVTFDGAVSVSNEAGNRAALSVQDDLLYTTDKERGSEIKISAGTFEGTEYGVWYSCGMDIFTLEGSAEIKGGPTGLQVADNIVGVAENSINISGGTVTGTTNGIYYNYWGGSVNINVTGGTIGEITSGGTTTRATYGIYVNQALTVENALKISDKAAISGSTAAVWFHAALNAVHAAVISGGTFKGERYGIYYEVDGENANDGLLIEGGTFTGTGAGSYGFFFADNPWSGGDRVWNNVAIIGGTFSGGSRAIGTADTDDCRGIRVSDVFVEHTGQMRFGYNEEYDVNWRNDDPYKTPINTGDYVFNDYYGAPGTDFTLRIYDPNNPNIS